MKSGDCHRKHRSGPPGPQGPQGLKEFEGPS